MSREREKVGRMHEDKTSHACLIANATKSKKMRPLILIIFVSLLKA